jgi:hypothetical protein
MALGSTQPLTEMSTRGISWGIKAAGAKGRKNVHLGVPTFQNLWEHQPPGDLGDCPNLYRDFFTFIKYRSRKAN